MNRFAHPHLESPAFLAPGKRSAPAVSIYCDKAFTLTVTSTKIQMTIGGSPVEVDYVGHTAESLAERIGTLSNAVSANPLNLTHLMPADFLYHDGERTADGGYVIRMEAHVVRYSEETRIRLLPPHPDDRSRPWWPRVDRGNVVIDKNGVRYVFGIPEYAEQEWSVYFGPPFVDVRGVQPEYLGEKLIRLPFRPIFRHRDNIEITVNDIPTGSALIEDVDCRNGFVRLNSPLIAQDRISVSYVYREDALIYKGVDLNPSQGNNPAIIDRAVLIYLVPESSSQGAARASTVRHTVGKTIVGALTAILDSDEPALILGAYQVRPATALDELTVTDVRRLGGGLSEHRFDEAAAMNRQMHSLSDWGRYEGTPFPGAQSGILTVPRSLLDTLDADHVEQLVRRHMAAGGVLLVDFSDNPGA